MERVRKVQLVTAGFDNGGGGRDMQEPQEAGKGEETDSPIEPPESNAALRRETRVGLLSSECKVMNSRCFKPRSFW